MIDFSDCYDNGGERLLQIEKKLAQRLNIKDNIRQTLFNLAKAHQLEEDELVQDWHQAYAYFVEK